MLNRIILTGKNKDFPKTVRMPVGVAVDGAVISCHIQIAADQAKCRRCDGWGTLELWDGNPSHREETVLCQCCKGDGIVTISAQEDRDLVMSR